MPQVSASHRPTSQHQENEKAGILPFIDITRRAPSNCDEQSGNMLFMLW